MKKIVFLLAIILPVICMGQKEGIMNKMPLYVIDGVIVDQKYAREGLSPNDVKSVCISKVEDAINKYGDAGRYGVISISLKKPKSKVLDFDAKADIKIESWIKPLKVTSSTFDYISPAWPAPEPVCRRETPRYHNPLFVVNGVITDYASFNFRDIKDEDIKSISFLKDSVAVAKYGEAGKYGVMLLNFKEEEYEATVLDPGFDVFLATQQSKEFYSEANLKSKNTLMVAEWNYRYNQPLRYNPQIYEVKIDYESHTDYGLEVEYKLYMFFKFMEKQHKMSLTI